MHRFCPGIAEVWLLGRGLGIKNILFLACFLVPLLLKKSLTCSGYGEAGSKTLAGIGGMGQCSLVLPHLREIVEKFKFFLLLLFF